jgi:hypothetical protein
LEHLVLYLYHLCFQIGVKIALYLSVIAMSAFPPSQAYKLRKIGACARWFIAVAA